MKIVIKTIYIFACYKVLSRAKGANRFQKLSWSAGSPRGEGWSFPNILIMCTPLLGSEIRKLLLSGSSQKDSWGPSTDVFLRISFTNSPSKLSGAMSH